MSNVRTALCGLRIEWPLTKSLLKGLEPTTSRLTCCLSRASGRLRLVNVGPGVLHALTLALAPTAPALAADEIFLKLDQVVGESNDARHRGEIELLSITNFGKGPARGSSSGRASCPIVTLTKYVDVATPQLYKSMVATTLISKAVITFRRPGQPPFDYFRIVLDHVWVTEIDQSNTRLNFPNPAPPRAIEKVTLDAQKITMDYFLQQADGKVERRSTAYDCVRTRIE